MRIPLGLILMTSLFVVGGAKADETPAEANDLKQIEFLGGRLLRSGSQPDLAVTEIEFDGSKKFGDESIGLLRTIRNLRRLSLDRTSVTDAGLNEFLNLVGLTQLSVRNTNVTDIGLEILARHRTLTELDISGTRITADCVAKIRQKLPTLTILNEAESIQEFQSIRGIIEQDQTLPGMPVRSLRFNEREEFREKHMPLLGAFKHLKVLHLDDRSEISDAGFQELKRLKELTELNLTYTRITDAGLKHVGHLHDLARLRLFGCNEITDAGLKELTGLQKLTSLDLGGCDSLTSEGLSSVALLADLETLDLGSKQITNSGLRQLVKLKKLSRLGLENCEQITDLGVLELTKIKTLRSLDLWKCRLSDVGMRKLVVLSDLEYLYLGGTRISDSGLVEVHKFNKLKVLDLSRTVVSDEGMKELSKLDGLEYLYLRETAVTDSGVKELVNLKRLKELSLQGCQKIVGETLKEFQGHPALTVLRLDESAITAEKRQELRKVLPNVRVN